MKKRLFILLGAVTLLFGCTAQELAEWVAWHARDPEAAIAALPPKPQYRNRQGDQVWNYIARCESGGRWDVSTRVQPTRDLLGWSYDRPPLVGSTRWEGVCRVALPRHPCRANPHR